MVCLWVFFSAGVYAGADIALGAQAVEYVQVLPFAVLHQRGQQHQPGAFRQGHDVVHHLAHGLGLQGGAVLGAAGFPDAGVQQPQIIVDLGDRAHRGAGVVGGGFLFDGNGRAQALDQVHVRFLHQRQELPGVGREGFHVAALTLGIQGIEGQGGLARAGQAGDDDEPVPGQVQVHVLQIVGTGAANTDAVHGIS